MGRESERKVVQMSAMSYITQLLNKSMQRVNDYCAQEESTSKRKFEEEPGEAVISVKKKKKKRDKENTESKLEMPESEASLPKQKKKKKKKDKNRNLENHEKHLRNLNQKTIHRKKALTIQAKERKK